MKLWRSWCKISLYGLMMMHARGTPKEDGSAACYAEECLLCACKERGSLRLRHAVYDPELHLQMARQPLVTSRDGGSRMAVSQSLVATRSGVLKASLLMPAFAAVYRRHWQAGLLCDTWSTLLFYATGLARPVCGKSVTSAARAGGASIDGSAWCAAGAVPAPEDPALKKEVEALRRREEELAARLAAVEAELTVARSSKADLMAQIAELKRSVQVRSLLGHRACRLTLR